MKENNLGPVKKISCISGSTGPIFILQRYTLSMPSAIISFYEMKLFTRALRNTDIVVSVPKCSSK